MDEGFKSQPVRDQIKESKKKFESNEGWVKTRRLQRPEGLPRSEATESYVDILPRFERKTFLEHLHQMIEDNGKARYLDIGGGAGLVALDLREIFSPEELDIVIIGHQSDIEKGQNAHFGRYPLRPTEDKLKKSQIGFVHSDFVQAHRELGSNSFDVVTACWSLNYIEYSSYAVLKKVWRQLAPNGIAFLYPFSVDLVDTKKGEHLSLIKYLQEEFNFEIESHGSGMSFRRTDAQLPNNLRHNIQFNAVELSG